MKENSKFMYIKNKVTIVIPCYNEEKYISQTITSIVKQYNINGTKVIIADNNSTDRTRDIINECKETYKDIINIQLIDGGKVSVARNNGAKLSDTKYTLFLDADSVLIDRDMIDKTLFVSQHNHLHLVTAEISSVSKDIRTSLIFRLFNLSNRIISIKTPFAIGGYFFTRTDKFNEFGGFDESLTTSEDFWLSKKYDPKTFKIINRRYGQDDRRFKKMGYLGMVKLILKNFTNKNNIEYFKKDVGYWN
jgi:glycosyltransferase involved in cell wall biosynthesis